MRTFNRADWNAAQQAWAEGEFSDEWREVRHVAALRGLIYPPNGTRFDSWEDDDPTERAIIIRAIRYTPVLLRQCIASSRSWGEVAGKLIARANAERVNAVEREGWDRKARTSDEPSHVESVTALRSILQRIENS